MYWNSNMMRIRFHSKSTINYDSPENALYSWRLEGFYEKWTQPGTNNLIRFTNLPPGKYTLHVRAVSREEHDVVFQERSMKIIITQPFWLICHSLRQRIPRLL